MSYIAPNSTIQFLSDIPFDVNYENTIYFDNVSQQETWMSNKVQRTLSAQSYTRVSRGVIRIGVGIDDTSMNKLFLCNYMRFKNTDFENKWWYAFIDSVEYVNNNTVEAAFHLDVIQTFMFNLNFNDCLIEREHTATDNFGEHTLPEELETGPYRSIPAAVYLQDPLSPSGESYMYNRFEYQRCIIMACQLDNNDIDKYASGVLIPGAYGVGGGGEYYSGVRYYCYPLIDSATQGVYQLNFSGTWSNGDRVLVDDVMTTLTAEQAQSYVNVANAVANNVLNSSAHYTASASNGVVTLYEKQGEFGYGFPTVETNSLTGVIYPYTVTPGNPGGILANIHKLNAAIMKITEKAKSDAIVGIFMMPYEFYPKTNNELTNGVKPLNMRVAFPTSLGDPLGGYVPRNKKLFCSPYNEIYVTNNSGNEAQYRFEDFSNPNVRDSCMFSIWGNVSMNPGMYCAPMFYNGNGYMSGAIDDELVVTGFPMCSYAIDSFKAWLAQNAGVIGATAGSLVAGWASLIGGSIAMGSAGLAGTVGSGVPQLPGNVAASQMNPSMNLTMQQPSTGLIGATLGALGTLYDHSRRPPQSHGANNGNLIYQAGQLTFSWYYKQIKPEYAEIIDKFFDMYGYKVNRVGKPLVKPRPKYWYVKTIGCSLKDTIPNDYLKTIESIFDKGIRFWSTNAVFGEFNPAINNNTV